MAQFDLPLPEITVEDFERSWTRFGLVADAKEWNEDKRLSVIPALLRGSLLDHFLEVPADERKTVSALKEALAERAGLTTDSLKAAQKFMEVNQREKQRVTEYARELKGLFQKAHKEESLASPVLLQKFLAGLQPQIRRQVLLKGQPAEFTAAVKTAVEVEYAFRFEDGNATHRAEVCSIEDRSNTAMEQLQQTVSELSKQVQMLQEELVKERAMRQNPPQRRVFNGGKDRRRCFACGKFGHIQRQCHLNSHRPASMGAGSWQEQQ